MNQRQGTPNQWAGPSPWAPGRCCRLLGLCWRAWENSAARQEHIQLCSAGCGVPRAPSPAGKGQPPLGAPATSREAVLSPQGAWVGSTGWPAASTWTLLLPSVLALQPGAGGWGPAPGRRPRADQPVGGPCSLRGPCGLGSTLPLLHTPHTHGGPTRREWALVCETVEPPPRVSPGKQISDPHIGHPPEWSLLRAQPQPLLP